MAASTAAQLIQSVTPTLDTSAYADNDVLFNSVEIQNVLYAPGRAAELISISAHDLSDQAVDFDLIFTQNALTLGTINAAVSAADSAITAAGFLGHVSLTASANAIDLINGHAYTWAGSPIMLEGATGSKSIHMSGVLRSGTPTFAAAGLVFAIGVRRH